MIQPFALKDAPSLIERLLPAQKISAEAQKERKAGAGQTLTALGSYWKGRKPLILVKACVLGSLLPATGDSEKDLDTFEKLMAIDDRAFLRRVPSLSPDEIARRCVGSGALSISRMDQCFMPRGLAKAEWDILPIEGRQEEFQKGLESGGLRWSPSCPTSERNRLTLAALATLSYLEKLDWSKRPEEINNEILFGPIWDVVNDHLGTQAQSFPELIEQLGILRFGHRPRIGDTFCGGGSIPFEAARLGCDVYASDLNPIACMLTWGALNVIGADQTTRLGIEQAQRDVSAAVDREMTTYGIEHDCQGNRAKAYLYCIETRCPETMWMVPLSPTWVISTKRNVIAQLVPDHAAKRFRIDIVTGAPAAQVEAAKVGTIQDGDLVYTLDGETYRTSIKSIRGDYRLPDGTTGNNLRRWEKHDFTPRRDDIFQERLYCIQWITKESLNKNRQVTFFKNVTEEDIERERKVEEIVRENLTKWQEEGLVPDMPIEPGDKTDEPIRTRGWSYWHHLFGPRQLLLLSTIRRHQRISEYSYIKFANELNFHSKLCGIHPRTAGSGREMCLDRVFINQALNTLTNFGVRSSAYQADNSDEIARIEMPLVKSDVSTNEARLLKAEADILITDPPYADAVQYHEITEYFVAWLRKNPPEAFRGWIWDTRRALAIKGSDQAFRREMVEAYRTMAQQIPDNGIQIVMFTHQDAGVWADMASIVWGAGLRVTFAWYIATETSSERKKGGYVQGTVLLVLRKRLESQSTYRDELVQEVRFEVAKQIETMVGLNQAALGHGRGENLFEDADLQMAGYAAALRVLTGYTRIDGEDMTAEALRPRTKGQKGVVEEIIGYAVHVANEHLVPAGLPAATWERLSNPERYYLKMMDLEKNGLKKLDNYQNFAKAFRFADSTALMGSLKPNAARLKTAGELKRTEFESEFGHSALRSLLYAFYELECEVDTDEVMSHLREMVPAYFTRREDLMAMAAYIAAKRELLFPAEAQAARILLGRIQNERVGG